MTKHLITVTVNGTAHAVEVEPRLLLVHFLREELDEAGKMLALRVRAAALYHSGDAHFCGSGCMGAYDRAFKLS